MTPEEFIKQIKIEQNIELIKFYINKINTTHDVFIIYYSKYYKLDSSTRNFRLYIPSSKVKAYPLRVWLNDKIISLTTQNIVFYPKEFSTNIKLKK